jgi:hypothetical protein
MTRSTRLCSRRGWWLMAARSKISLRQAGEPVPPSRSSEVTNAKLQMHTGTKSGQ